MNIFLFVVGALPAAQGHSIDLETAIANLMMETLDFSKVRMDLDKENECECMNFKSS